MKKSNDLEKKSWKSRLKLAIAGLALAGAIVGGVSAATPAEDNPAEDTTEVARSYSFRGYGVSWR